MEEGERAAPGTYIPAELVSNLKRGVGDYVTRLMERERDNLVKASNRELVD